LLSCSYRFQNKTFLLLKIVVQLNSCWLDAAFMRDAEWSQSFECRDALRTIVADGRRQPKFLSSCVPDSVTEHEIARAVVQILERNPERFKERFDIRATTALHEAWPCSN
jgi:hypothetical protein